MFASGTATPLRGPSRARRGRSTRHVVHRHRVRARSPAQRGTRATPRVLCPPRAPRAALREGACRTPRSSHPAALQPARPAASLSARPVTRRRAAMICRPPPTALMARCFRSSTPRRRWTTAGALRGIVAAARRASGALQMRTLLTRGAPRCRASQHRRGSALQGRRRAGACLRRRGCSAGGAVADATQTRVAPRCRACGLIGG